MFLSSYFECMFAFAGSGLTPVFATSTSSHLRYFILRKVMRKMVSLGNFILYEVLHNIVCLCLYTTLGIGRHR